jgi:hypothetical protein
MRGGMCRMYVYYLMDYLRGNVVNGCRGLVYTYQLFLMYKNRDVSCSKTSLH